MLIKQVLSTLEQSDVFSSWHKENPESYLAHFFCMIEKEATSWQIGYYNKKTDTIASFDVNGKEITLHPPEEIFKKSGVVVKELQPELIKTDLSEALVTAQELQEKKYPVDKPIKKIVVLQTIAIGQVYNITYVTKSFKTLNIKINSETGNVVEDQLAAIFSFDKGDKSKKDK